MALVWTKVDAVEAYATMIRDAGSDLAVALQLAETVSDFERIRAALENCWLHFDALTKEANGLSDLVELPSQPVPVRPRSGRWS